MKFISVLLLSVAFASCSNPSAKNEAQKPDSTQTVNSYGADVRFLKEHLNVIELVSADSQSRVAIAPQYQGRVMTTTAQGNSGRSFGWLNNGLISSGKWQQQFNPVGGEERFWLGPEGGQYSLYFKQGDSFNFKNWQVPALIDTVAYDLVSATDKQAEFSKEASLINYSGTTFNLSINRKIILLDRSSLESDLGSGISSSINAVAYRTVNAVTNKGNNAWTKERGLPSIWLLGMFTPSPSTVVIIPFQRSSNASDLITSDYFGTVPSERLRITDSILFFLCDGKYRSKIGIPPSIAKPMAASFDYENNVLTIVVPQVNKTAPYVNSKWELQKEPYKGDVINSYNDGPLEDGSQMGPFYEIESSSPALALKTGETATYTQLTCHLQGSYAELQKIARVLLGVDLDTVKQQFLKK